MSPYTVAILSLTTIYAFHIGLIPSISDSYKHVDKRIYHTFFFASAFLIGFQGATDERLIIPYVIVAVFFWWIGLAAAFWAGFLEGLLHTVFTYVAISGGLALTIYRIWPVYGWESLYLVAALAVGALLIKIFVKKNSTLWGEYWAYVVIFTPIL